ncbi:MAG: nucleotidyltransferase domain-containing protein [Proteobacteria bacterium]|nr:nucleotidyltransferase domain-containing protein [Pseudomonadota bacterium]
MPMKNISQIKLSITEQNALLEMKESLAAILPGSKIILYGSKARGDSEKESDIDLFILLDVAVTGAVKDRIRALKYDVELKYDVVISVIIENSATWQSALARAMPLHQNIDRDGVAL